MKVFKIRRKADGLFSTGGTCPSWNKIGKTWNSIGHIKNHLNLFKPQWKGDDDTTAIFYTGCEIVTYETTITEINSIEVTP